MLSIIDLKINKLEKELFLAAQHELSPQNTESHQLDFEAWNSTDASLFVGDNFVFLKEFALKSPGIVDACYIDPPYNTGSKFLYEDNRKSVDDGPFGPHSAWMRFMLQRLVAARELLKSNGIIAVSIDDYEFAHLKILMDKIFGGDNFIGNVIVCRSKNGKGSKKNIAPNHEYLLLYGKSNGATLRGQPDESKYEKHDEFGWYRIDGLFRKKGEASLRTNRPNMFFPLYYDPKSNKVSVDPIDGWKITYPLASSGTERRWLWGIETTRKRAWQLHASKNGVIYIKNYAGSDSTKKRTKVRTLWSETNFYTERATNEVTKLFGEKVFDTPKPLSYIKKIIDICGDKDAVILDFFAGSGTTAQAVAELNSADHGSRKCILMENDSVIPSKHVAREHGFTRVSEITQERLKLIKRAIPSFQFQVFSLESDEKSSETQTY